MYWGGAPTIYPGLSIPLDFSFFSSTPSTFICFISIFLLFLFFIFPINSLSHLLYHLLYQIQLYRPSQLTIIRLLQPRLATYCLNNIPNIYSLPISLSLCYPTLLTTSISFDQPIYFGQTHLLQSNPSTSVNTHQLRSNPPTSVKPTNFGQIHLPQSTIPFTSVKTPSTSVKTPYQPTSWVLPKVTHRPPRPPPSSHRCLSPPSLRFVLRPTAAVATWSSSSGKNLRSVRLFLFPTSHISVTSWLIFSIVDTAGDMGGPLVCGQFGFGPFQFCGGDCTHPGYTPALHWKCSQSFIGSVPSEYRSDFVESVCWTWPPPEAYQTARREWYRTMIVAHFHERLGIPPAPLADAVTDDDLRTVALRNTTHRWLHDQQVNTVVDIKKPMWRYFTNFEGLNYLMNVSNKAPEKGDSARPLTNPSECHVGLAVSYDHVGIRDVAFYTKNDFALVKKKAGLYWKTLRLLPDLTKLYCWTDVCTYPRSTFAFPWLICVLGR